jgi:PAS domain S-box-containing protein
MKENSNPRTSAGIRTKDKLLSSIFKISSLLTRSISIDRILTDIVEETARAFDFTRVAIFLIDREKSLLECKYILGFTPVEGERALSRPFHLEKHRCIETSVALSGKTIYIRDHARDRRITPIDLKISRIHGRVSTVAVPLRIKRDVIGLIEADRNRTKMQLTRRDIELFSIFANQASIVIENARLQDQNKKKIRELLFLQEVSRKTSSTLNLRRLSQVVSTGAVSITNASAGILYLRDEESGTLRAVSRRGCSGKRPEMPPGGLAVWAARNEIPLLSEDTSTDPRCSETVPGTRSEVAVPLISEKKVLGVLNLFSREKGSFSEDDIKLLTIFASHAASLIRNARLYDQVIAERNLGGSILESSPNGVITVDLSRRITSVNRKAEEIFRWDRRQVVGRRISELLSGDIPGIVEQELKSREGADSREIRHERGGSTLILGASASLLRGPKGVSGALIIFQDLTESKRTEELIRRMDRLTSLGQLSAGIAHEIRNPLASINFNVQMLMKKSPLSDGDRSREILRDTLKGVDRIKTLVKGMLDFTKPAVPHFKRASLNDVLSETISLLDTELRKKGIRLDIQLGEPEPEVVFDPYQVQQVFLNLILNALEAMPNGGKIMIRSGLEGERLAVRIADTGVGIAAGDLAKIFDPFFTTKPEGTGLGLSIVHKILEQHHAQIEIDSREGRGTAFLIRFPVSPGREHVPP